MSGVIQSCPVGFYSWGGDKDCHPCPAGWVCANGLTLPCASEGKVEEGGSCVACPVGHNCRNGVEEPCPPGTYAKGGEGAGGKQCIPCEPGRYAGGTGNGRCEDCEKGKTSGHGREDCEVCPREESTGGVGAFPCVSGAGV